MKMTLSLMEMKSTLHGANIGECNKAYDNDFNVLKQDLKSNLKIFTRRC